MVTCYVPELSVLENTIHKKKRSNIFSQFYFSRFSYYYYYIKILNVQLNIKKIELTIEVLKFIFVMFSFDIFFNIII